MGRRLQTSIPQLGEHLSPKWPDLEEFRWNNHDFKMKQKEDFDYSRHHVRTLPPLPDDTEVWVTTENKTIPGKIISSSDTPRSYLVDTSKKSATPKP